MKSRAIAALTVCLALCARAFDATPLTQYCTAQSGNWWDGLGLSYVWRIDDGAGTNIVCTYGGPTPAGAMSGTPWSWTSINSLVSLQFGRDTAAIGSQRMVFPPVSSSTIFNMGADTSFAAGCWIRPNWFPNSASPIIFGTATSVSAGSYQLTTIGSIPYGRAMIRYRADSSFISVTNQTPLSIGTWQYIAVAIYPRSGIVCLTIDDVTMSCPGATSGTTFATSTQGQIGNGYLGGAVRDFWIKHDGGTNTCTDVYNATRRIYGK